MRNRILVLEKSIVSRKKACGQEIKGKKKECDVGKEGDDMKIYFSIWQGLILCPWHRWSGKEKGLLHRGGNI